MQSLEVIHIFFLSSAQFAPGRVQLHISKLKLSKSETTTKLAKITAPIKNNYQFNILV